MAKVSIIIPAYNAEKTIKRCVDSVLSQDYKDFELIVGDDGCTDGTGAILDEYAKNDPRVLVIHKENSGVSDTRNVCMRQAVGEYIQFIDSDDWITPDATRLLVRDMEDKNADMVIADFYRVVGERVAQKGDIDTAQVLTRKGYADAMMQAPSDFYYGVLWNKLYKRQIIADYDLSMDVDLSWCEDFIFNLEYVLHAETIAVLHSPVYYYMKTEGSLVEKGASGSGPVRMKLNTLEYYDKFYQNIYKGRSYAIRKPVIYGYLLDFAKDGGTSVINSKKLGKEGIPVMVNPSMEENIITDRYYRGKLLDRYMKEVADRNVLEVSDVKVLLYIRTAGTSGGKKEAADYTGLSVRAVSAAQKRLEKAELITRGDSLRAVRYSLTEKAEPIARDLDQMFADYDSLVFAGLDKEQIECFKNCQETMRANIRRAFLRGVTGESLKEEGEETG